LMLSIIKNKTSDYFLSFGYNIIFNNIFPKIKNGKLIIEIKDEKNPIYNNTLVFGDTQNKTDCSRVIIYNINGFISKLLFGHDIGMGEAYMVGDYTTDDLKTFIKVLIMNSNQLYQSKSKILNFCNDSVNSLFQYLYTKSVEDVNKTIKTHYNLSNELYELMLGKTMCYSSAMYSSPDEDLDTAQLRKFNYLISKSNVKKEDHILEIGCGWGTFLIEIVKKTGCRATGISLSEEQIDYARKLIKNEGLDHLINVEVCHYQDITGKYSHIFAIESMEHVGPDHFEKYFSIVDRALDENGLIVSQISTYQDLDFENNRMGKKVGFINKYIFHGGELPCLTNVINGAAKSSRIQLDSVENISQHYSWTLDAWTKLLLKNKEEIMKLGFDQQFINMFEYYYCYCSAGFETRYIANSQLVLSRPLNVENLKTKFYN
ncbi:hypothetical protein DICPUDRAFT_28544, partial [Dictyostelium purpureum]